MKKKTIWLLLSCLVVATLVLVSCGPAEVEEEEVVTEEEAPPSTPPAEEADRPAEEAAPPSIPMSLYENTEHGFSIEYPEGWFDFTGGTEPYFQFLANHPQVLLFINVIVVNKTEEAILSDVILECKNSLYCTSQFELISEGNVTIGEGISGYEIVGKDDCVGGRVDNFRFIVLVREQQGFWFGVRGEPAYFDQQEETIDAILDSFKLLATYTFVVPPEAVRGPDFQGSGDFTSPIFQAPVAEMWSINVSLEGLQQDHDRVTFTLEVFKKGETTPFYKQTHWVDPDDPKSTQFPMGASLGTDEYYLKLSGDNLGSWVISIGKLY